MATECTDCTNKNTAELKHYLLSTASVNDLGSEAERNLQHTPDYEEAKHKVEGSLKKVAFWDGVRQYSGIAGGMMTGMFGGAVLSAFGAEGSDFNSVISNPVVLGSGAGILGLTGLNVYTNYRIGKIHTQNNFCQNEAGGRKSAEYGKLSTMHHQGISLATSEYAARRTGEEVERAMDRSLEKHGLGRGTPDTHLAAAPEVMCNKCAAAHHAR